MRNLKEGEPLLLSFNHLKQGIVGHCMESNESLILSGNWSCWYIPLVFQKPTFEI